MIGSSMAGGSRRVTPDTSCLMAGERLRILSSLRSLVSPAMMMSFSILGTDKIEWLIDMIQKQSLLPWVRFGVNTTHSNPLDDAVTGYIFRSYNCPRGFHSPGYFNKILSEVLNIVLGCVDHESRPAPYSFPLMGVGDDNMVGKMNDFLQRLVWAPSFHS